MEKNKTWDFTKDLLTSKTCSEHSESVISRCWGTRKNKGIATAMEVGKHIPHQKYRRRDAQCWSCSAPFLSRLLKAQTVKYEREKPA